MLSGNLISEWLAAIGVIGSMIFVGMQIRDSSLQARAAAVPDVARRKYLERKDEYVQVGCLDVPDAALLSRDR
jgi:hypothetical protein